MNSLVALEKLLSIFEDTREHREELLRLLPRAPGELGSGPQGGSAKSQELVGEALYQLNRLEEARGLLSPPLSPNAAVWLGHTLFDLEVYSEAKTRRPGRRVSPSWPA